MCATFGRIVEHDLVTALRTVPDAKRGWQAKKTSVRCQSCQAISVFDSERVGQRCDFCGSPAIVPHEERAAAARMTLVPRSFASAVSPFLAGYLLTVSTFGWPLLAAGAIKIVYDALLLTLFRGVRPPEER